MAYAFTDTPTFTIVELPEVTNSEADGFDNDDRGGGVLPVVRAGTGVQRTIKTVIRPVGSANGLTLVQAMALLLSCGNWTVNTIGPGPVAVEIGDDSVQTATITVG